MTCNCVDEMPSVESCARCQNGGRPLPPYRPPVPELDERGVVTELLAPAIPVDVAEDEQQDPDDELAANRRPARRVVEEWTPEETIKGVPARQRAAPSRRARKGVERKEGATR